MRMSVALVLTAGAALALGCGGARASAGAGLAAADGAPQAARERCRVADTLDALPAGVYRACEVDQEARPRGRTNPTQWEPSFPGMKDCYSALVGFVVDAQGTPQPHTAKVIRTNDPDFARAIMDALPSWRYSPAMKDGQPVPQWMEYRNSAAVVRVVASSPSAAAAKARAARRPRC